MQGLHLEQWEDMLAQSKKKLLKSRLQRTKPALDDKCITSWNALLAKAFAEASKMKGQAHYFLQAEKLIEALCDKLRMPSGLFAHVRTKGITAEVILLEDQVTVVDALLVIYEVSANEHYLMLANEIMRCTLNAFSHDGSSLLANRMAYENDVIGLKFETSDNVIPCANSIAANCLLKLGRYFDNREFSMRAALMINEVSAAIDFAPGFSNWLLAAIMRNAQPVEVVFTGSQALQNSMRFHQKLRPFTLSSASTINSELPLLKDRNNEQSLIYVCRNQTCEAPVLRFEDLVIE
jgi:uncharacterized protein YyaL (SSP411 family)